MVPVAYNSKENALKLDVTQMNVIFSEIKLLIMPENLSFHRAY